MLLNILRHKSRVTVASPVSDRDQEFHDTIPVPDFETITLAGFDLTTHMLPGRHKITRPRTRAKYEIPTQVIRAKKHN
jgi:hypothetical protein